MGWAHLHYWDCSDIYFVLADHYIIYTADSYKAFDAGNRILLNESMVTEGGFYSVQPIPNPYCMQNIQRLS